MFMEASTASAVSMGASNAQPTAVDQTSLSKVHSKRQLMRSSGLTAVVYGYYAVHVSYTNVIVVTH